MRRIKLEISYDGSHYSGWQRQTDVPTIQGTLELALQKITGESLSVTGSGRTDAGVHALKQIAAFSTQTSLDGQVFQRALNGLLPSDIRILHAAEVAENFHPISCAKEKRYRYLIDDNRPSNPFLRNYCWSIRKHLDENVMRQTAQALIGQHDFACFQTQGSPRRTTVRTITDVLIQRVCPPQFPFPLPPLLCIEIQADGFLYNMMRAITGTLVDLMLSSRFLPLSEMIVLRDRSLAGQTAPPQGLYLLNVFYYS